MRCYHTVPENSSSIRKRRINKQPSCFPEQNLALEGYLGGDIAKDWTRSSMSPETYHFLLLSESAGEYSLVIDRGVTLADRQTIAFLSLCSDRRPWILSLRVGSWIGLLSQRRIRTRHGGTLKGCRLEDTIIIPFSMLIRHR